MEQDGDASRDEPLASESWFSYGIGLLSAASESASTVVSSAGAAVSAASTSFSGATSTASAVASSAGAAVSVASASFSGVASTANAAASSASASAVASVNTATSVAGAIASSVGESYSKGGFAAVASLAAQKISTTSTEIGGAVAETASKASELAAQTVQQLNETYDLAGKTEAAAEAAVVYADELKQQTRLGVNNATEKIAKSVSGIGGAAAETAIKASELATQTAQQLNETYDLTGKAASAAGAAIEYTKELSHRTGATKGLENIGRDTTDAAKVWRPHETVPGGVGVPRVARTHHLDLGLIQAAVVKTSALTLQATDAVLRAGLQNMLRMVMAKKKLPDALVGLFAQHVGGDAEAIQATLKASLDRLAKGEISPELDMLLSEFSEPLSVPETDLRTWCLELGQGEISDEMWNLLREKITDLQPFITALTEEKECQS